MAAETVDAVDDCAERFSAELAGSTYRIMRALARGPQVERYFATRYYGVGFPKKSKTELMSEMGLDSDQFEELHRRAVKRLRRAQRGDDGR